MDIGFCSKCAFKTPTERKYGTTYSCDKEVTHMDVTYFTHEKHTNEQNTLCPLMIKNGG